MAFTPAHTLVESAPGAPRTAFILHGILGSSRNWSTFARHLAERTPGWRYVLVDLRNHGDSHGAPPPHTLTACARDLATLADDVLGVRPDAVIGHSFGGKVALVYARDFGVGLSQVWSLDSPPGATPPPEEGAAGHEVESVIAGLQDIALPLASRAALVEALRAKGFSETLSLWMTTNLQPLEGGGFGWRFDLAAMPEMLTDYLAVDLWPFLRNPPENVSIHMVRALKSDRWTADELARFVHSPVRLHVLPDSGHWVHADNPEGLMRLLAPALLA